MDRRPSHCISGVQAGGRSGWGKIFEISLWTAPAALCLQTTRKRLQRIFTEVILKRLRGMRFFHFVNFEYNLYEAISVYSLLILNKIQKLKKRNVKARKNELALFPRHILSCKEAFCKEAFLHHTSVDQGGGGGSAQHLSSVQRWADGINMWPNAVGAFKRLLVGVWVYKKVCLGVPWIH